MSRLAPYIVIAFLLAVAAAFAGGQWHGQKSERARWEARIASERAAVADAARREERTKQEQVNEALRRQNQDLASINAGLRADLDGLRQRPERPAGVSEAPRTSCQGANGPELAGEYAEFLARYAALAAEQDRYLAACYEYADTVTAR